MSRKVKIQLQTALANGDKIDINNSLGFSITNHGTNDATYGYEGNAETFELPSGDTQLYGFLPDGFEFDGQIEVKFKKSINGKIGVKVFRAITQEK